MVDNRPKPKYGELAPEGWEWKPPAPPAGSDVPVPSGSSAPGAGSAPHPAPAPFPAPGPTGARADAPTPVHRGDIIATGLLLFLGILFSASMVPALFDFTRVLSQAAAMQGYGSFAASPSTQTAGIAAGIATIILNLLSIVVSVRRVQRRRLAFFVPIVFGVLTFAIWIGVITFAFFNDPGFLQTVTSTTQP